MLGGGQAGHAGFAVVEGVGAGEHAHHRLDVIGGCARPLGFGPHRVEAAGPVEQVQHSHLTARQTTEQDCPCLVDAELQAGRVTPQPAQRGLDHGTHGTSAAGVLCAACQPAPIPP